MSSSVYSLSDSIYKKATQFYNEYISNERVQREKLVKDRLQEINHGDIIFSKNNVCIHLNEPYLDSKGNSISKGACNKNCLPGYFSIKLIKCEPELNKNIELRKEDLTVNSKRQKHNVEETSFITEEKFDLDKEIENLNKEEKLKDDLLDDLNSLNLKNDLKSKSKTSNHFKRQEIDETGKNSIDEEKSIYHYSMLITWIPNLIFEEKSNKLTRNLSFKPSNTSDQQSFKKRHKSLNNLSTIQNTNHHKINRQNSNNVQHLRSYSSDFQLNLNSSANKSTDNLTSDDKLIFTIDIKKIKSLKLFFGSQIKSDEDQLENSYNDGQGQLVIGNYDLQYKIFHFHNGLNKLEQFLNEFDFIFCFKPKNSTNKFLNFFDNIYDETYMVDGDFSVYDFYVNKFVQFKKEYSDNNDDCQSFIKFYTIDLPALNYLDLQNEFNYKPLSINSLDDYNQYFSPDGQLIYDFEKLKTRVFFGSGCEPSCRKYFWPYLLNRFSTNLSTKAKNEIKKHGEFLYKNIDLKRRNIKKEDKFYRKYIGFKSTILEDVPRTDRNNPQLDIKKFKQMQRILLNYTIYSQRIGYTQGFSDLLAPLIIILKDESESEIFFNFVYLLEKKQFFCFPNDDSIDTTIAKIRELLRVLDVKFYNYFKQLGDQSFQLLFTHRWMLLCFRREFEENSALRIWEICWSEFQVQFQLFICVAIIQIYGQDLIEKQMNSDDILFYFGNLSQKMNFDTVIKKARSNLFQLRSFNKLPCTLRSLCQIKNNKSNNPSNWTTQLQPYIECIKLSSNPDGKLLCTCDK